MVDTWWQTETGAIMIAPLPGLTTTKPGSATFPLPGIGAEVVDEEGTPSRRGGGYLTLTRPGRPCCAASTATPSGTARPTGAASDGRYFAGDGAKSDDDGYLWLLGRVDDVMNVSGHRISTTEVESALVDHHLVAEAAVVGASDQTTGQAIVAFVTLVADAGEAQPTSGSRSCGATWRTKIGPIARPKTVIFTDELPKTRSGKIMRRLLRDVAEGRVAGRHHDPGRPGRGGGDPAAVGGFAGRGVAAWATRGTGPGTTDGSNSPARRWSSTWTVCCPMPSGASTSSSRDGATGTPSSTPAARTPSSTSWRGCSNCSTRSCQIILLTGRPMRVQPQTLAWLERYDLRWDLLVMRARGDYSQVTWYKRDSVDELRHFGFDLRLAFEDDPNNFAMFHAMGIPCVYIHSGYYE